MNITSKCRCGSEFSVDYTERTTIHGEFRFKDWLSFHSECPSRMNLGHTPFIRKVRDK